MIYKIIIPFLLIPSFMLSQRCGKVLTSSSIKDDEKFEQNIQGYLKKQIAFREDITIPVVFHILWYNISENVSDERIFSQLEVLNKDYNAQNIDVQYVPSEFKPLIGKTGIHFCLAVKDSQGVQTVGIIRKQTKKSELGTSEDLFFSKNGGSDSWESDKYLNIWVTNTGKLISGYGSYPTQTDVRKTGIVIHPNYFGINGNIKYGLGRVATHEVGHFLGLKHTWGDKEGECEEDDNILDTPPQKKPFFDCPNYPKKGCSDSEMFMTFMDYVDDPCMLMFTNGQKERMLATINIYRNGLLNNNIKCPESSIVSEHIFSIYPNPSYGYYNCKSILGSPMGIIHYEIYNNLGNLVKQEDKFVSSNFSIDLHDFSQGLYLLKIGKKSYRLVKI